ncbi:MAG: class I SAM-dependent methyltransferase, partial [SAR324 cluster bacterium]|nr:class I SAM-dependent methyltransferase [SAR324 cluster bacterium]
MNTGNANQTAPAADYTLVTEIAGAQVTRQQVERHAHRYYWAAQYCAGKDVLEVACGNGQGLGYLAGKAGSLIAGDISPDLLARARALYGERKFLARFDAHALPFAARSLDVVLLFEAIYYLSPAEVFVRECRRVLRKGGVLLLVTANKDLYDFSPSLYSNRYYGAVELRNMFASHGFEAEVFGYAPVHQGSLRQRLLRPLKKMAVAAKLLPRTMAGKKWLKRLVFGSLVTMPRVISEGMIAYQPPHPLDGATPDKR